MAPLITLYILAGCVAAAAVLFIVMIVLSALRPPQLPDVSFEPEPPSQPLQRVIRALTPVPLARALTPIPVAVPPELPALPMHAAPMVARPVVAPPVRPQPPPQPPPVQLPPRVAPSPAPRAVAPLPAPSSAEFRRPVYPQRRERALARIVIGLMVTSVLLAGAVVAYPAMLDPLCDDYTWPGEQAARIVRDYAHEARVTITSLLPAQ